MLVTDHQQAAIAWRASDVPQQIFGRMGRVDVFIIGRDREEGCFRLGTKIVFGQDRGMITFDETRYLDTQQAQQVAQAKLAEILAELDQFGSDLAASDDQEPPRRFT